MAALALVTKDFLVVTGNSFRVYCPIHKALSHTDARREPFETRWNLWKRMCFECPPLVKKETADRSENEKESLKMNKKKRSFFLWKILRNLLLPHPLVTRKHTHIQNHCKCFKEKENHSNFVVPFLLLFYVHFLVFIISTTQRVTLRDSTTDWNERKNCIRKKWNDAKRKVAEKKKLRTTKSE